MSNKVYDILKTLALVVFPPVIVCATTLNEIWNFPNGTKIILTISALSTLLGAVVKGLSVHYNRNKVYLPKGESGEK